MRYLKITGFITTAIFLMFFTGCGGGCDDYFTGGGCSGSKNNNSTPTISISIAPSSPQVNAGGTVTLTVTTQNTDIQWPTLASATQGTFTTNGKQAVYTAPMVTANTTIEFTVTAAADMTKKATAQIRVNTPPISIDIEPLTPEVIAGGTITLTVTAQNTDFIWPTLAPEQGTFTTSGNVAVYTAPMVAEDTTIDFSVTATADATKKATAQINVKLPTSVDDYSDLEPAMASNPHRALARVGETTEIGIPDYLLPSTSEFSVSILDTVTATFEVHEEDSDIAEIISQNGRTCTVRGRKLGSARIIITVGSANTTVILTVVPFAPFYTLTAGDVTRLGSPNIITNPWWWSNDRPDSLPNDYMNYFTDPTYQLAWNWRNKGQTHGASGEDSGIDILAYFVDPENGNRRGWVRTTYGFGGWHYDLNGVTNQMTDGVQVNGNVKLELTPEFIYDNGVPYLQITHTLTNTGSSRLTGQKFGASADVMIFNNDRAPLTHLQYGALMTNEYTSGGNSYPPTVKLRLISQNMQGIDNVNTMWLGRYGGERSYVYDDQRESITAGDSLDTALNFSYQGIDLNAGQSKTYVIRFTQTQIQTTQPQTLGEVEPNSPTINGKVVTQEIINEYRDNCVFFARWIVPTLPYGLDTMAGKRNIINSNSPSVGSVAIMPNSTGVGHVAVVEAVNGDQITLIEANLPRPGIFRRAGTHTSLNIIGYYAP